MARQDGHLVRCEAPLGTAVAMPRLMPVGPLPGVELIRAGGWNGAGIGVLKLKDSELSWQAPHSQAAGTAVDVTGGGQFYLADGSEPDKWVLVDVTAASLPGTIQSADVELGERWNNAIGEDDTAADTADNWTVYLKNNAGSDVDNVAFWLDAHEPDNDVLTIKVGTGATGSPGSEIEGLALWSSLTIVAGASVALRINRSIAAGVDPAARKRVRIWVSWDDGEGGRAKTLLSGNYRIAGTAEYRAYHDTDADPTPGDDTPLDTSGSLPFTPSDDFSGDADNRFALTRCNAYGLEGPGGFATRIIIATGAEQDLPPLDPYSLSVSPLAGGKTRVTALAPLAATSTGRRATHWALWYTTDGSAPGAGDPDYTEAIQSTGLMIYDGIPAQAGGVTVKVAVKTKGANVYSESSETAEWQIKAAGPQPPQGGVIK